MEEVVHPVVEILDEEMPEGAEITPDESDAENEANKLNIDVSDLLVSNKTETTKQKKKTKKKKRKNTNIENGATSSEDEIQNTLTKPKKGNREIFMPNKMC